jgi:hypothetical protein
MQFRVPQFIDMEDKVVGPFTLKQFGYVLGAGGLSFVIWTFIPVKIIAIILIIIVVALFLSLAFLKINGVPFANVLESAFSYYSKSKVYTWKQPKEDTSPTAHIDKVVVDAAKDVTIAKVNKDRLHDVALGLDVFDRQIEESGNPDIKK